MSLAFLSPAKFLIEGFYGGRLDAYFSIGGCQLRGTRSEVKGVTSEKDEKETGEKIQSHSRFYCTVFSLEDYFWGGYKCTL